MAGWHHLLDGHDFEQAPGVGEGQGSPVCCSPWVFKETETTERLKYNKDKSKLMETYSSKCPWVGSFPHRLDLGSPPTRFDPQKLAKVMQYL